MGSLSLLQGIFLAQALNPGLLHCRWILYQLSYREAPGPRTLSFSFLPWKMETMFSTFQVCSKLSVSWNAGHSVLEPGKFQANQDDELVTYRVVVRMKSAERGVLEKSSDGWGPVCTALHSLHNTSTLIS